MSVDRQITLLHLLLGHPQRDEELHDVQQDERADRREDDDPGRGEGLPLQQVAPPPEISPDAETPKAEAIAELAKMPVSRPPATPANPCV